MRPGTVAKAEQVDHWHVDTGSVSLYYHLLDFADTPDPESP